MDETIIKDEPEEGAFEEEYSSGTKCGNIFRTEDRKYTFICEFCEDNFDDMIQFGAHLEVKHFRNDFEHIEYQQIKVEINDCHSVDTSQETYQEIKVEDEAYDEASMNQDESLPENENLVDEVASFDKAGAITSSSDDHRFDDTNAYCITCDRRYASRSSFRKHLRLHKKVPVKENAKIFCELCNNVFKVPYWFRAHAVAEHGNSIPKALQDDPTYLACFRCNQPFETPLERHMHEQMHIADDPFVCSRCPKIFSSKRNRRVHMRTHDDITRYSCPNCKVSFRRRNILNMHILLHHSSKLSPREGSSTNYQMEANQESATTQETQKIKVETEDPPSEEVKAYEEIKLEIDEEFNSTNLDETLLASDNDVASSDNEAVSNDPRFDEKNLYCVPCDRHYSSINAFKGHVWGHRRKEITEDFKIICEFCNIGFKIPHKFRAHVVSQHGNSIPKVLQDDPTYLACDRCNKPFDTPLERHEHEQTHKAEDPYHCRQCSKSFTTQSNRRSHIRDCHKHQPLLPCPQCPRTFRKRHALKAHIRLHMGVKPFPCEICGKRFKTKSEKSGHGIVHQEKNYKCEECGQLFRTKSNLKQHLHHHSDVRYKCEHCEKECDSKRKLKSHLVKHSDERPYECAECKATFKYPASLRKHLKSHDRQKS